MVEQVVVEDMVDYIVKLGLEMTKRNIPISYQIHLLGFFISFQFNATRNDTNLAFEQIIGRLNQEYQRREKKDGDAK